MWLIADMKNNKEADPYNLLVKDPLLCKNYRDINCDNDSKTE